MTHVRFQEAHEEWSGSTAGAALTSAVLQKQPLGYNPFLLQFQHLS